ncbi:replication-associated recombination protein A [Candidatus Uhrbacteria bacterium]|nr:replication-associated recombination protein A [Candidatus Uhrbacteria bacterium]
MKDLFDTAKSFNVHAPLADRMRPQTLDDIVGQEHILGEGKVLRSLIENDALHSIILWGPPGVGKTTIASVIARVTGARFVSISAVNTGLKEAREIIERARDTLKLNKKRTILFIDEIHRFNKAQQDAFLPAVENGTIVLIGATTENPSFEVNSALLSRSRVFVLEAHTMKSLSNIIDRALSDAENGLGAQSIQISEDERATLTALANGDARSLLNIFDIAVQITPMVEGFKRITKEILEQAAHTKLLRYDAKGEEHYNVISALIKSMRNSDPDAALYWLARMIDAGEDPLFIARRMVIFASEDVGLADAQALTLAVSAFQAVHAIGMPEGRIILGHTAAYLARAAKNNSAYRGIESALADAKEYGNLSVPLHLRNAVTGLMKDLGYGKGYQYAHDHEDAQTDMQCLPDELAGKKYLKND